MKELNVNRIYGIWWLGGTILVAAGCLLFAVVGALMETEEEVVSELVKLTPTIFISLIITCACAKHLVLLVKYPPKFNFLLVSEEGCIPISDVNVLVVERKINIGEANRRQAFLLDCDGFICELFMKYDGRRRKWTLHIHSGHFSRPSFYVLSSELGINVVTASQFSFLRLAQRNFPTQESYIWMYKEWQDHNSLKIKNLAINKTNIENIDFLRNKLRIM